MLVAKELKDYLFLLMIILQVIIKFLLILPKNNFFQEKKLKIATLNLIDEMFMINQFMT